MQLIKGSPLNKLKATKHYLNKMLGGIKCVMYHSTVVFGLFEDGHVGLWTGGYYTATTARRMNQALAYYKLPYHVYRKGGDYHVRSLDGQWTATFFTAVYLNHHLHHPPAPPPHLVAALPLQPSML